MIPENHGANQTEWVSEYRPDGEQVYLKDVRMLSHVFPYPWQLIHRVDLHNALKDIATSSKGKGTPAILHLRSRVKSVDVNAPSLTLEDGATHTGDLVIGADGIHSKLRNIIGKDSPQPKSSGTSAFRFMIPIAEIRSDPRTAHFVERTGEMRLVMGTDRRLVFYPCRNNTLINFVALHPEEETEADDDSWNQSASKEAMQSCFSSFSEDVRILISKAQPENIQLWKLLDHDELGRKNWTSGKVCLIGDAAHGFLPHQGQGGSQAMEDGAALGALFPLGTQASDVARRLELYVEARYDRATMVQDFTRQAAFKTARSKHGGKVLDLMQFTEANFNHDAYDHARGILLKDLNKTSLYQRMPLSFGPSPGPRQDLSGRARSFGKPTYKTSYIKFKTYRNYLKTLLPTEELSIGGRGGWVTATFSVTQLSNLDWLGGRGYSFFGLYIHDVVHTKTENKSSGDESKPEEEIKGDFLPVLFENMADPIITGREELGFSKVFATLDETSSSPSSFSLSAGWEGTEFCSLTLEDLVEVPAAEKEPAAPTLHYKVTSAIKKGDAFEPGSVTTHESFPVSDGQKEWLAGSANIKFTQLKGQELELAFPTLANIVEGLRNVKVVEVLKSGRLTSS